MSAFTEIIERNVPSGDRSFVGAEANFRLNWTPGIRPSDAAASAVKDYQAGRLTAATVAERRARQRTSF